MKNNKISILTAFAVAAALALAACGGGGGDSSSGSNPASSGSGNSGSTSATTGNVSTPLYAQNSAQLAVFNTINAKRQQCGFPALTENTVLDSASQAHAAYMGLNSGAVTDTEVSGNPGFTGVSYTDRAVKAGFPANAVAGGLSAGFYTNATLTETEYGEQIAVGWLSGVYHIELAVLPITQIGIGWNELQYDGYPEVQSAVTMGSMEQLAGNLPLTYPCQGSTDVPYLVAGETPAPPTTSGSWGAAIGVAGNPGDTIRMSSGTLTDSSGNIISLQVLDSSNDMTGLIKTYEGRAYPATPLSKNATYTATINGTYNGAPFTRTFSYTTGTKVG